MRSTEYAPTKVERLRVVPEVPEGSRPFTVLVEVVSESDRFLVGYEVNRDGELDERLHLIEKSLIRRRTPMRMNLHYGWLEEVPKR